MAATVPPPLRRLVNRIVGEFERQAFLFCDDVEARLYRESIEAPPEEDACHYSGGFTVNRLSLLDGTAEVTFCGVGVCRDIVFTDEFTISPGHRTPRTAILMTAQKVVERLGAKGRVATPEQSTDLHHPLAYRLGDHLLLDLPTQLGRPLVYREQHVRWLDPHGFQRERLRFIREGATIKRIEFQVPSVEATREGEVASSTDPTLGTEEHQPDDSLKRTAVRFVANCHGAPHHDAPRESCCGTPSRDRVTIHLT